MTNLNKAPTAPLAGVRIIDAGTFIAAPFAAAILGEFGAEVIKIEKPGIGDPLRRFGSASKRGDSYCWLSEQRNKKSITLDLQREEGQLLFKKLVKKSDVLCENFRPGTLEKWGIGWPSLKKINPELIMLRVSGYGQTGPLKDRPGFARIAHAFGGLSYLTGMIDGPPLTPGSTSLADYISGLYGAIGVLIAVRNREAGGPGQQIDVALYESVFRVLDELVPLYAATGAIRPRLGVGTANACPHGQFQCSDGKWVAIACTSDKMWARMALVIGMPELSGDLRYATSSARVENRGTVDAIVDNFVGSHTRDDVIDACVNEGVPIAPVYSIEDIFHDSHYRSRMAISKKIDVHSDEEIYFPSVIPLLSETPGKVETLGPTLGESNDEVFQRILELSKTEYEDLKENGVI